MKTLLLTAALALATGSALAGVAPGCIGGCMGSAPNPGDITLPAGYQCKSNWPFFWPANVSCVNADESPLTGAANNPHVGPKHHKS